MPEKIDFKKDHKDLYAPTAKAVSLVTVPDMHFLMIDGQGDPNTSQEFRNAVEALYNITYTIKFLPKKGETPPGYFEYSVPPLEGRWWVRAGVSFSFDQDKSDWRWTIMIMQPSFVTAELMDSVVKKLQGKKDNPALTNVRFEDSAEGLSAQIMHVGPFSTEEISLRKIYDYLENHGYEITGKHHEIYLSDFRRIAPEKLRTVLRYPIARKI